MPNLLLRPHVIGRRGKGKAALRLCEWLEVFCGACIQAEGDGKGCGFVGRRLLAGAFELVACHRFVL